MSMARKQSKINAETLTLTLDGSEITAEKFVKSVSAFVAIIRDVTESLSGEKNSIKWIVSVEKGSTRVHFTPRSIKANPAVVKSTIDAVKNGFLEIEQHGGRPSYWSDASLKSAKEMASVYSPDEKALDVIRVSSDGGYATVTKNTSTNVDSLVGTEKRAFGTVEGRLRTVTESGGLHVVVQDALTNNKIRCFFEDPDTDRFVAAFKKRVSVYGEIRYARDGAPLSIKASDIRVMRESTKLPSIQEMIGIYA
jgi:hypothetical protein